METCKGLGPSATGIFRSFHGFAKKMVAFSLTNKYNTPKRAGTQRPVYRRVPPGPLFWVLEAAGNSLPGGRFPV